MDKERGCQRAEHRPNAEIGPGARMATFGMQWWHKAQLDKLEILPAG